MAVLFYFQSPGGTTKPYWLCLPSPGARLSLTIVPFQPLLRLSVLLPMRNCMLCCAATALTLATLPPASPRGACSAEHRETLAHMSIRCPPICKEIWKVKNQHEESHLVPGTFYVNCLMKPEKKMIWAEVTVFHWQKTGKHITVDLGSQFYVPVFERIWYKSQDHHSVLKKYLDISSPSCCQQLNLKVTSQPTI